MEKDSDVQNCVTRVELTDKSSSSSIQNCRKDLQNEAVKTEPIKLEPYCDHTINSKEIDTIVIDSDSSDESSPCYSSVKEVREEAASSSGTFPNKVSVKDGVSVLIVDGNNQIYPFTVPSSNEPFNIFHTDQNLYIQICKLRYKCKCSLGPYADLFNFKIRSHRLSNWEFLLALLMDTKLQKVIRWVEVGRILEIHDEWYNFALHEAIEQEILSPSISQYGMAKKLISKSGPYCTYDIYCKTTLCSHYHKLLLNSTHHRMW